MNVDPHKIDAGLLAEAQSLLAKTGALDLHLETTTPWRIYGYNPKIKHKFTFWFGRLFGHTDLPRLCEGGVTGGLWSISTNISRGSKGRLRGLLAGLFKLEKLAEEENLAWVTTPDAYLEARAAHRHAVIPVVQGANAFDALSLGEAKSLLQKFVSITLIHMTSSQIGESSSPFRLLHPRRGLTQRGAELVQLLNSIRVFVDLAHAHPRAFWAAVEVHDKSLPIFVSHTGVQSAHRSWRNLNDAQIKAVANSGGVVGLVAHWPFLCSIWAQKSVARMADHMEAVARVGGWESVGVGTDLDGFILPVKELRSVEKFPLLVAEMIRRGWTEERIEGILFRNFLNSWRRLHA